MGGTPSSLVVLPCVPSPPFPGPPSSSFSSRSSSLPSAVETWCSVAVFSSSSLSASVACSGMSSPSPPSSGAGASPGWATTSRSSSSSVDSSDWVVARTACSVLAVLVMAAAAACATGPMLKEKFSRPRLLGVVPFGCGGAMFVQLRDAGQDVHARGGSALRHSQRDCGAVVQHEER